MNDNLDTVRLSALLPALGLALAFLVTMAGHFLAAPALVSFGTFLGCGVALGFMAAVARVTRRLSERAKSAGELNRALAEDFTRALSERDRALEQVRDLEATILEREETIFGLNGKLAQARRELALYYAAGDAADAFPFSLEGRSADV